MIYSGTTTSEGTIHEPKFHTRALLTSPTLTVVGRGDTTGFRAVSGLQDLSLRAWYLGRRV